MNSTTSLANGRKIDSGFGFSCGSGLGHSLIRPFEVFTDTISGEDLLRRVSVYSFVNQDKEDMIVDKLTQKTYGPFADLDRGD
jgi:hypothetical protein